MSQPLILLSILILRAPPGCPVGSSGSPTLHRLLRLHHRLLPHCLARQRRLNEVERLFDYFEHHPLRDDHGELHLLGSRGSLQRMGWNSCRLRWRC
jgi:hypothetical protein